MTKPPLIILAGPTAAGKTALSIRLAQQIGGSVISADSMQIYKYMDIGSAKITREEMQGIPHYLIDELMPEEEFNIYRFNEMANAALAEIYAAGRIPIVVGGTGFYIRSLLYHTDFTEEDSDPQFRRRMEAFADTFGNHALHEKLREIDPESYHSIHENNRKRVIRALEFYEITGQQISEHNRMERSKESPYNCAYFVLTDERALIYDRINRRVDAMMEQGLLDEVRRLSDMGCHKGMVSMQGLGYKELLDYLDGSCLLEEAVYRIKRDTRHFAKRQLTWFKSERDAIWLNRSRYGGDDTAILEAMLQELEARFICHPKTLLQKDEGI